MGVHLKTPARPQSEINVTPLVDVVLVLLIIFMVLTPLLEKELPVRVPEVSKEDAPPPDPAQQQYVVTANADGTILFNGEKLPEPELKKRIDAHIQGRGDRVVFFDAEDKTNYGQAVHVLDLIRSAGARTIGFMTERPR